MLACGVDALRTCLKTALTPLVQQLHVERSTVFDALDGIQFLPVEKDVYLRLQAFVNLTEQMFTAIDETAVMFHEHLLYSGFDQATTRTVYAHVAQHMRQLAGSDDSELNSNNTNNSNNNNIDNNSNNNNSNSSNSNGLGEAMKLREGEATPVHVLTHTDVELTALDAKLASAGRGAADDGYATHGAGSSSNSSGKSSAPVGPGSSLNGAAPLARGLGAPPRRLYVWRCGGFVCVWLVRRGAVTPQFAERLSQFALPHGNSTPIANTRSLISIFVFFFFFFFFFFFYLPT